MPIATKLGSVSGGLRRERRWACRRSVDRHPHRPDPLDQPQFDVGVVAFLADPEQRSLRSAGRFQPCDESRRAGEARLAQDAIVLAPTGARQKLRADFHVFHQFGRQFAAEDAGGGFCGISVSVAQATRRLALGGAEVMAFSAPGCCRNRVGA